MIPTGMEEMSQSLNYRQSFSNSWKQGLEDPAKFQEIPLFCNSVANLNKEQVNSMVHDLDSLPVKYYQKCCFLLKDPWQT